MVWWERMNNNVIVTPTIPNTSTYVIVFNSFLFVIPNFPCIVENETRITLREVGSHFFSHNTNPNSIISSQTHINKLQEIIYT